mmetsp:Transcript_463/g.911  ORF Transcript_463/g.911 Transcript_463/m.911 type:complete len:189 (+) Transcript_463:395-961(+)|eukprot:CAMPEP_0185847774 /NCGR_PEP_ID=MMETSP1354-20130828/2916_1 /TAXON_ID=708628 /ORGANISM="Erythrolobus madagascarensis, Strain CCMP3276" /LENGTH=188 /DNA_ID=CAMNT_0028548105 /DNA_START=750 /DNA_END=1316 /DNA_ORIENTATION=+
MNRKRRLGSRANSKSSFSETLDNDAREGLASRSGAPSWNEREPHSGQICSWDLYNQYDASTARKLVLLRVLNSTVLVPLIEEVYFRSLINNLLVYSLTATPAKNYSSKTTIDLFAATVSSIIFGAAHLRFETEWLCGAAYGALMHALVSCSSKSPTTRHALGEAVFAHSITNLTLALYVITTSQWHFW